jgi:hypothetical protein
LAASKCALFSLLLDLNSFEIESSDLEYELITDELNELNESDDDENELMERVFVPLELDDHSEAESECSFTECAEFERDRSLAGLSGTESI